MRSLYYGRNPYFQRCGGCRRGLGTPREPLSCRFGDDLTTDGGDGRGGGVKSRRLLSLMVVAVLLQLTFSLLNSTSSLELLFFYGDECLQPLDTRLDLEDLRLFGEPLGQQG